MRLLDLFCGAGGCSMGYRRAGFDVTGVDIRPQPHYPFPFIQADALEYVAAHGHEYDMIHASPPCQAYSALRHLHKREYPDLVAPTREALRATDRPYVIENVVGAPLHNTVTLCSTMFGLTVYRHRLFESNVFMLQPSHDLHRYKTDTRHNHSMPFCCVTGKGFHLAKACAAMGIDWMSQHEIAQAIPPAYMEWIGKQIIRGLTP